MYQQITRPETLFRHAFGEDSGYLVTFTGQQARFTNPEARPNELAGTRQLSWSYPEKVQQAADYLVAQAQERREAYFGVHLFREPGNRLAANTVPTVRTLWLDEDDGHFPETGPEPTAIIRSSAGRRHLYWLLTQPVPGTANYKRDPQVDLVVGEFTGALPWEPEVLDQAIPERDFRIEMQRRSPKRRQIRRPGYTGALLEVAIYRG